MQDQMRRPPRPQHLRMPNAPELSRPDVPDIDDILAEIDEVLEETDAQKDQDCGCWHESGKL